MIGLRDSVTRFSPKPLSIPSGPFRFFSKIRGDIRSSRCTTDVVDTSGKWKKYSIKNQQFDNCYHCLPPVSLIPVAISGGKFAAGIVDTGGKFATSINNTRENGVKLCHRCCWYRWCTLTCEYLREFSKKFETVLMDYSGAGGKLIHQKNQKQKISWHCLFNYGIELIQSTFYLLNSIIGPLDNSNLNLKWTKGDAHCSGALGKLLHEKT